MLSKKTSVLSLMGKQVLDLEKGIFLGYIIDTYFEDNKKISGFQIIENDAETTSFIEFSNVKCFEDDIVVLNHYDKSDSLLGKTLFDVALVTSHGKLIAHTWDMAVDSEGNLLEFLLEKPNQSISSEYVVFTADNIQKIGQEVLVTDKTEDELIFELPDGMVYRDLETGRRKSEYLESIFKKLSVSLEDITSRVKHLDKDVVSQEFGKLASTINKEVSIFFDGMLDKLNLKKKTTFDTDIEAIYRDLGGKTVLKPICDSFGEALLLPGQVITIEKIELVIKHNLLADLYRLAVAFETEVSEVKIEE